MVKVGDVSLEPVHIALIGLSLCVMLSLAQLTAAVTLLIAKPYFWIFITAYLFLSLLMLTARGFTQTVVNLLPQFLYIPAFLFVYSCFVQAILSDRWRTYYVAAGVAILMFFAAVTLSAIANGLDALSAWSDLVVSRSFHSFNRAFTQVIFNGPGFEESSGDFIEYSNSIKNELASCVIVLYAIMKSMKQGGVSLWSKGFEIICFALVVFVTVLSFSRSAFISLVAVVLISFIVSSITGRSSAQIAIAKGAAFVLGVTFVALGSEVGQLVADGFSETASYESRLEQFSLGMRLIEANLWFGTGWPIEVDGRDIHNLFIATWAKSGILPLLFVLLAYLALVGTWLTTVTGTVLDRTFWRLAADPSWVVALAVVPMFRVFLSGKGGTFSISMWLGTAAFLAFVVANHLAAPVQRGKITSIPAGAAGAPGRYAI